MHEFEAQKNHEVNEFRTKMRTFCEERAQERQRLPWHEWMEYSFPCDLEPCPTMSHSGKLRNIKKIFVNVKFEASEVRPLFSVLRFLSSNKLELMLYLECFFCRILCYYFH